MTDRELLELAAKANGFGDGKFCWTESEYPKASGKHGALWNYIGYMDTAVLWNPLADDGDALRLAVTLGMDVLFTPEDVEVIAAQHAKEKDGEQVAPWACESWTLKRQDPLAATRRAIVRAAAEIGRSLP